MPRPGVEADFAKVRDSLTFVMPASMVPLEVRMTRLVPSGTHVGTPWDGGEIWLVFVCDPITDVMELVGRTEARSQAEAAVRCGFTRSNTITNRGTVYRGRIVGRGNEWELFIFRLVRELPSVVMS